MRWLVLAFIVFPFVELYLLLAVGHQIGFWPTLGLTVLSGVVGTVMAKREGLRVLREWQNAVHELRPPEQGVLEGALVIAGSVLLITPGMLSDLIGLLFLIPPTRRLLAKPIRRAVQAYIARGKLRVVSMGIPDMSGGAPWGAPGDFGRGAAPFGSGPFGGGPFGGGPFGDRQGGPFGRAPGAQSRGDVVDTTGESVSDAPRQLPGTRR